MADSSTKLAQRYFEYVARHFPVMCASDEFHFLPRAQAAADYYDQLDNLDSKNLARRLERLKAFQEDFVRLANQCDDLEEMIDLELLQANVAGILIEFERKKSWQYNPLLYLKIAFIGLDHALNKPGDESAEHTERVLSRLSLIPGLLRQAVDNISSIPQTYHQASRLMLVDCREYLRTIGEELLTSQSGDTAETFSLYLDRIAAALNGVDDHLRVVSVEPDGRFATETLNETLKNHFLNIRNVNDIYSMAQEEWEIILERLEKLRTVFEG